MLRDRARDERGQTTAEYAVMLGLITAGIVAAIAALSSAVQERITAVVALFTGG